MNKKETKISKDIKINKKPARRNYSNQTGITLIALVVTILILLILAGITINMLFGENGILARAKNADNTMKNAQQKDLDELDRLSNWIDEKTNTSNGGSTGGDDKPTQKSYEEAGKENGVLTENATYTDSENTTVTIPKGFKVSDVAKTEDTDGEQTVSTGLVIQDASGNEFVWIPVNYTATGVDENNNQLDDGFEATFKRSTTETGYTEPSEDGYTGEDTEYLNMMKSVQANKGFYIGRYEAGTTTPRTSSTTTNTVVVKRDAYPYIYVKWGDEMNAVGTTGAVYLSKQMYDDKNIGATSTLCYGVQWDATMKFVEDSTHSTSNSTTWGNYMDNLWNITRTTASWTTDPSSSSNWTQITSNKEKTSESYILLTTGASDTFKAKNIFDLAGNVFEWTMEAYYDIYRVDRGGDYDPDGSDFPASGRSYGVPTDSYDNIGFRPALYL